MVMFCFLFTGNQELIESFLFDAKSTNVDLDKCKSNKVMLK